MGESEPGSFFQNAPLACMGSGAKSVGLIRAAAGTYLLPLADSRLLYDVSLVVARWVGANLDAFTPDLLNHPDGMTLTWEKEEEKSYTSSSPA